MTTVRSPASARAVVLLAAAFFVQTTSGCLSNEYRISRDELQRLAQLPPETRGHHVQVSQELGERRGDAVDPPETLTPSNQTVVIDGNIDVPAGGGGGSSSPPSGGAPGGSWRGTTSSAGGQGAPSPGWRGAAPSSGWRGGGSAGGVHPTSGSSGFHGTPSSSGGGGSLQLPSGGNGGDALAALVVAIIIGAALATIVLAASEGARFAGEAELSPEQPLHLHHPGGGEHEVALGALTPAEAAAATDALVMDDEGWGLRRLAHGPIDRRGATFRFELGGGAFTFGGAVASGFASHVQVGGYVTQTFGLVLDGAFSSGDVDPSCCVGPIAPLAGTSLRHDALSLQAELTPLALGPLHLGVYGGGGVAIAGAAGAREQGPMAIGGARLELELTAHMALTVRAGASTANLPTGWTSSASVTGGLAIY